MCGLEGEVTGTADLVEAPEVDSWEYQGTTAYPVSAEYGPAATDPDGFRYCFQHSPEGALYAAANAVVQASEADESRVESWLIYFMADTPERDEFVSQAQASASSDSSGTSDDSGTRLQVAGFNLMSYDGTTAKIDMAVTGSASGQTVNLSAVYELVWEDGDWKLLITDPSEPVSFAQLPHVAGYTVWEA